MNDENATLRAWKVGLDDVVHAIHVFLQPFKQWKKWTEKTLHRFFKDLISVTPGVETPEACQMICQVKFELFHVADIRKTDF